ncbi:Plant intracellular Ras-group-related LRR protein 7 [Hibiscus syriacus]|uniref:Plant intracellular Ras-group-related LRR protein 7 n=1 Tax=Hibiscus syriacus TaxID=106335 RepID=A0A6A2WHA0_HIBSY|nr:Plant intracellular Ras-group-related LRR protein 7 [Hibiscus syriacus]
MGCFQSRGADSKANRIARWRSTGIVALRDAKLKARQFSFLGSSFFLFVYIIHNSSVFEIPMDISNLVNMQRLILATNLIERLPINLGKLQALKVMILDGNQITSLPDELGQLVRLEKLSISGNMLMSLPETIGSLRNLSLLNVSNNKLKYLPESVGSCFSLEELQANDNLIEELPASVCNLVHLKSLCLNNNKISQIPPNLLKDCKALQNISLHDNPISMDQFQQMEGFQEFEARRKKKFDKQIDSNVMIGSKGLDEVLIYNSAAFTVLIGQWLHIFNNIRYQGTWIG